MLTEFTIGSTASPLRPTSETATESFCANETSRDRVIARACFGFLVIFHLCAVTIGLKSGLLQGNEFRQSQTALTTLFVQREHNFSLAYPTPVLGKPWSIPMEFPLYQWTVSVVSSATGLPLIQSARAVSCVCFYLALPAIWLLLRRLRLAPTQRWVALSLMLSCPLYVFYARAFLIETMALMFSLWFLQGFIAAVEERSSFWIVVANVAGVGAGLVKVTTFMLYLVPAAGCSIFWLWQTRPFPARSSAAGSRFWRTIGWIGACVALPFVATWWWVKLADMVKALNPSGAQLISSSMNSYHFGTWQNRLSSELWLAHWKTLTTNLTPIAGLLIVSCVAVVFGGRWRKWILGIAALFVAAPMTFPVLYAWHEYYFVANGVLLLVAGGLALSALVESTLSRWVVWSVIFGMHAIQCWGYFHFLYPTQRLPFEGGSGLTRLLRDITDPQDVLLIAGNDWSSVIPFYAERRALMIRTHLENDPAYLDRAFAGVADESVPVLILVGALRENRDFLAQATRRFDIDPTPFLIHKDQTVYVARAWRNEYSKRLFNLSYNDVTFAQPSERRTSDQPQLVSAMRSTRFFDHMTPQPERYQVPFGLTFGFRPDGSLAFDAHAPSRLWFHVPPGTTQLSIEFGISEDAYLRTGDRTDGVEFTVVARAPDGKDRTLFSRILDPVRWEKDRATQRANLPVSLAPETELIFETRPGPSGSNAFDWSYWKEINLH